MMMALVMMAIATTLAVSIWYMNQLSVARINNIHKAYQAKHYSQGLMLWANDILREDYAQDENQHDSNLDAWHRGIEGMVVEDAILSGTLIGLNGRFNINNLVIDGEKSLPHIGYMRRLLLALEMDVTLVDKMIDWIDADQVPEPNGAEDFVYLAKSPAYQTSGRHFQHIAQLGLLDGITADEINRLSPHLIALPVTGQATRMNVNTMSSLLLSALHPQISGAMAVRLNENNQADYVDLSAFFSAEAIRYVLTDIARQEIQQLVSVQTRYLQASSLVQMDDNSFLMFALVERNNVGQGRVLYRSFSSFLTQPLVR